MKFISVAVPNAINSMRGRAGIGLVMLALMPAFCVHAEEPKPAAPTQATTNPLKTAKPRAKSAAATGPVECVRTGQRVIAALARDDSGAANQFHNFYLAFRCSPQHLAQAFGCLVNLQAANPGLTNPSPEQVSQCWEDPAATPKVVPQTPAEPAPEKK